MADRWRKIPSAAKRTGLSVGTFRKFLKDGLRHVRLPSGTILIRDEDVDEFLSRFFVSEEKFKQVDSIVDSVMRDLA